VTRKRYAEGTSVSVESSRGEITGILAKHGVQRQAWASEPEGDMLQFELGGYNYRFRIARPTMDEMKKEYPNAYDWSAKIGHEWRRRWRANVLLLKAKLEFADGEASTVMRELMPYALLKDGRTLEEAVLQGDTLPMLTAGR
jgi:hypothetical protein